MGKKKFLNGIGTFRSPRKPFKNFWESQNQGLKKNGIKELRFKAKGPLEGLKIALMERRLIKGRN